LEGAVRTSPPVLALFVSSQVSISESRERSRPPMLKAGTLPASAQSTIVPAWKPSSSPSSCAKELNSLPLHRSPAASSRARKSCGGRPATERCRRFGLAAGLELRSASIAVSSSSGSARTERHLCRTMGSGRGSFEPAQPRLSAARPPSRGSRARRRTRGQSNERTDASGDGRDRRAASYGSRTGHINYMRSGVIEKRSRKVPAWRLEAGRRRYRLLLMGARIEREELL
jgi:hypothetical protein